MMMMMTMLIMSSTQKTSRLFMLMFVHFHDLIPADDDVMTKHTPHFTLCILSEDDDDGHIHPIQFI